MSEVVGGARWRFRDVLKNSAVEEFVDRWFHRPLAFLLIVPLQSHPGLITPTQITCGAMAAGVLAGLSFAMVRTGDNRWYIAGGLLVLLSVLLDCADGMLARLTHSTSRFGQVIDGCSDCVAGISIWAGMSYAISAGLDPLIAWPVNCLSLATILFHVGSYEKFRENFIRISEGTDPVSEPEMPTNIRWLWNAAVEFYESGYARCFRLAGGIAKEVEELSPQRFRALFSGPMQLLSYVGLGTHLALIYVLAFIAAVEPAQIFVVVHTAIIGGTNLVMLVALVWWRKRERRAISEVAAR